MGAAAEKTIHFAGKTMGGHRHVCAFFDTPEEEYGVTLPFVKEGIQRSEYGFHIVDPALRSDYVGRIEGAGIPVTALERAGQFEVRSWEEAYLRGGSFDKNAMLALLEGVLKNGKARGFPLTRLVAHMEWALEDRQGVDDLVEYETRLNFFLPKYPDPVICTYSTSRFGGGVVMDILRTHPVVIIGGVLQENPFYAPPEEFLRELHERNGSARH